MGETPEQATAYIPIPAVFLDAVDMPWRLDLGNGRVSDPIGLREVLKVTARKIPVKDAGEAERSLDVLNALKDETSEHYIALPWNDWGWMKARFREMAHAIWEGADSAYLRRYLDEVVTKTPPEPEEREEPAAAAAD